MNTFITTDLVALHTAELIAEAEDYRLAKSFRRTARQARRSAGAEQHRAHRGASSAPSSTRLA